MRLRRPRRTKPGTVWCVAEYAFLESDSREYNVTGIYHSDLDCPPLRQWLGSSSPRPPDDMDLLERFFQPRGHMLLELDPVTREARAWNENWEGWVAAPTTEEFNEAEFRPCLRCGQVGRSQEKPDVCGKCHLTICDCDE